MKTNIFKLLLISLISTVSIFAQTIDIKSGYQLKGAIDDINPTMFNNSCAKYLFKFDTTTQSWKAYVADGEDYGYDGESISTIKRTDGFWAMGTDTPCSIKINDKPNTVLAVGTPYIITTNKLDIVENEKDVIMLLSKGSTKALTYKIAGESEHRFFTIDATSGLLSFINPPNFEDPQDLDKDNIYRVKVSVSDGTLISEKTFDINVIDTEDPFTFISQPITYNYYSKTLVYTPIAKYGDGDITYTATVTNPDGVISNLSGSASFFYQSTSADYIDKDFIVNITATDGNGQVITQTFNITHVNFLSRYPVIEDISINIRSDEFVKLPLSAVFSENPDAQLLIDIDTQIETNPSVQTEIGTIVKTEHGTVVQKDDGSWWYRSDFNYLGTDSFTYKASVGINTAASMSSDRTYYYSEPATVSINVINSNHIPEIESQSLSTKEETPLEIKFSAYDYEQDNISFMINVDSIKNGIVVKKDTNTYIYTPNKDFVGIENIIYTANDGTSSSYEAQLNIQVINVNDAPIVTSSSYTITPKPRMEEISVLYDTNSFVLRETTKTFDVEDDTLSFIVVSSPKNGQVKIHKLGGYVYIPNFGYSGTDSFSYKAYDGQDYSDIATVNIEIKPIDMKKPQVILNTGITKDMSSFTGDDGDTQRGIPKNLTRDEEGFVIDHVTGLMWMDNGENLIDHVTLKPVMQFSNQDPIPDSIFYDIKKVTYEEAENYCSALTLGGYNDWRIPTALEPVTLLDLGGINTESIEIIGLRTVGSVLKHLNFKYAPPIILKMGGMEWRSFYVDIKDKNGNRYFDAPNVKGYYGSRLGSSSNSTAEEHGFMCVRGNLDLEPVVFEDKAKGVVLDTTTNLMWQNSIELTSISQLQQEPSIELLEKRWYTPFRGTTQESIEYCENSTTGGFDDWIMPTFNEIKSLDSEEKWLADTIYANSSNADDQNIDKNISSTRLNHAITFANHARKKVFEEIPLDSFKLFSFDGGESYVSRGSIPFLTAHDVRDKFEEKNSDGSWTIGNDEDFIVNGINYKGCLPLRDTQKYNDDGYAIREGSAETAECSKAYAKSCVFDNTFGSTDSYSSGSGCYFTTKLEYDAGHTLEKMIYEDNVMNNGQGTLDSFMPYTRCVRKSTEDDKTNFFINRAKAELEVKPVQKDLIFDKENNTFTNNITKQTYTRLVDNGDGTLTDNMTGMMIPKYMYYVGGKNTAIDGNVNLYTWEEAKDYVQGLNEANYLGYNDWSLPSLEDMEFFNMLYGYTTNDDGSQTSFLTTHVTNDTDEPLHSGDSWYLKEDEKDQNSAYISPTGIIKTALKTTLHRIMIVRGDRINANIKAIDSVVGLSTLTLDATNSYLGLSSYKDKIKYKWEYMKRNDSYFKPYYYEYTNEQKPKMIAPDLTIVDSDKAISTVQLTNVEDAIELRFKLTITIEGDDREFVDILRVDLINGDTTDSKIFKIAEDGTVLADDAQSWSCVKDSKTGLIWESKNDIIDSDSYYAKSLNYDDAVASETSKCGVSLRLPTEAEFTDARLNPTLVGLAGSIYSKRFGSVALDDLYNRYWTTSTVSTVLENEAWTCANISKLYSEEIPFDKSQPYSLNNKTIRDNPTWKLSTPKIEIHKVWLVGDTN